VQFKAQAAQLGAGWSVETPSPTRVTVVFTPAGVEAKAIHGRLAATVAERPENKAIDYAALGIEPNAKRAFAGDAKAEELDALLNGDPKALEKILESDQFKELSKKLEQGLGGADAKDPGAKGPDIEAMMKDPGVQQMVQKMMAGQQGGATLSADGKSLSNPRLGYTFKLGEKQEGWALKAVNQGPVAAQASHAESGAQITISSLELGMSMPMEMMGPQIEMGMKMAVPDAKLLKSGPAEFYGKKGWEVILEGTMQGRKMYLRTRHFFDGGVKYGLDAVVPQEKAETMKPVLEEMLNGLQFDKAAQPKP
jgi:hypothetical protein